MTRLRRRSHRPVTGLSRWRATIADVTRNRIRRLCLSVPLALALAAGCKGRGAGEGGVVLQGAGATFPYPLYSKWVAEFQRFDPRVRINYQSIGSGGGIRQVLARTVDFGASDAPMSDAEVRRAPGKILHVPTTLGAVVVAYNVASMPAGLKLTAEALAGIYLGEIRVWNDPRIAAINAGMTLPATPILVVHRADGSGTTAVFTEYLVRTSPAWKERAGAGISIRWPIGVGAKGNEGVTGQIKTSPGSIGYVELAYALQNQLPAARLRNRAGHFVPPTLESITAAAAVAASSMPEDLRVSIVDAPGEAAYPVAAFTYILVYEEQSDAAKGAALARFLQWAVGEGQRFAPALHYATLPRPVAEKVKARLRLLRAGGRPLLAEAP
jgi:phosphate transport system substrate-binding protein